MADTETNREIITRARARLLGLPHYFTGKPCIRGHLAERVTHRKHCVACHREKRAEVRARDPDLIKAQKAASYLRNRDRVIKKVEEYVAANREKVRVRRALHRQANKDRISAWMKVWCAENRPLLRIHERRRRDRKRGALGSHTLDDIKALEIRQKWKCANGGHVSIRASYHIDHIMPLVLGGTDDAKNIQLLCPSCNQSKHARHPIDWAQMNGRLL